jgi:hypothetical protein
MANPLFNQQNNNPFANLIQQAKELKKTVADPKAEVQRLLNSGQMSQEQFNSLAQMTKQILPYLK